MTSDIRNARFYVLDENAGTLSEDLQPLVFDEAFDKAVSLTRSGVRTKVLYTDEASQEEITRFVSHGIPAELASGA